MEVDVSNLDDDDDIETDESQEIWDWLSQTMNPAPELPEWEVTLKGDRITQVSDGTTTHRFDHGN